MSAYLEAVAIARDRKAAALEELAPAEHAYRAAIVRAAAHHSLREVGRAAGITHAGVRYIIRQEAAHNADGTRTRPA